MHGQKHSPLRQYRPWPRMSFAKDCLIKSLFIAVFLNCAYFTQAAKICNNMMLGISMIGVAETMNLGIRYIMDKVVFV